MIRPALTTILLGASVFGAEPAASAAYAGRDDAAICFLVLGVAPTALPLGNDDTLLVAPYQWVALTTVPPPALAIPDDDGLYGFTVYAQAVLRDPSGCPGDPVKTSSALEIPLGQPAVRYGVATGLELFLTDDPRVGGELAFGLALADA